MCMQVRVAIMRYVLPGKTSDVSNAVERFFDHDVLPNLPTDALHDSSVFRARACYHEEVDQVISRNLHVPSICACI